MIDGLDASGKSVQANLLCSFLKNHGQTVFLRFHPSNDNFFGVKAKQFLQQKGKGAHFSAAFFYMLDVTRSILIYSWRKFDYVIFVRYLMGTAYLPEPLDRIAYYFFALIVPTSNLMFFLDVAPAEAHRRICLRKSKLEMFENLEKLEKIRAKALALALEDGWTIIKAEGTVMKIHREIRRKFLQMKKFFTCSAYEFHVTK